MLLFSKRGWHAQELSPVLGSVGKALVSLARPTKQDFKVGGALLAASNKRKSPHLKISVLVAGVRDRQWSSMSHQRSSVTSFAYLRSVVHFCA